MLKKFVALSFTVALALGGVVALLWLLSGSQVALAQSGTGVIRVATTGSDTPGCGGVASPCQTVQYAVDQAQAGVDEIRVASGLYTGVQGRAAPAGYTNPPASGVVTQVVYISKTVTIRGGYTTAFTDPSDSETNPTTLDAQGEGRVLLISHDISPTIEGLRITGGDAAGLGGRVGDDAGGGMYVINAMPTINNNRVFSNTAEYGGGLYLHDSDATLSRNTVTDNTASERGGGLYLLDSDAMLSGNDVISNTAGWGGGLFLWSSDATLSGNAVISNAGSSYGGGLFLQFSNATLSGNTVIANTASQFGGGLLLWGSDAMLSGNTIIANTASGGGGLHLARFSDATLTNNVVADNQANIAGGGLHIRRSSPRLLHTTIARNSSGDGSGVYVTDYLGNYSTVALTDTILVSHTVGITVTAGNTATLDSTLWHSNTTDWGGAGTIITGTHNYWGDPLFDADGYHLMEGSAAIDKGVDAGVTSDIDNEPRDSTPDLGADEWVTSMERVYLPLILQDY